MMKYEITVNLIVFAFVVAFFAGLGWALAQWLVGLLRSAVGR